MFEKGEPQIENEIGKTNKAEVLKDSEEARNAKFLLSVIYGYGKNLGKRAGEVYEKIIFPRADYLKSRHPDFKKCYLYHVFIGSTPPEKIDYFLDFEDGDSILRYLEKIQNAFMNEGEDIFGEEYLEKLRESERLEN